MSRIAKLTSMQIEGLAELRDTLLQVAPREANNILRATVHGIAGRVRDVMRVKVTVLTGEVQKGIYALRRRGKPNFPVSEVRLRNTDHGLILEFGTRKTRAQPYIVPTVESMRGGMANTYREEFGKKLEKALEKRARKGLR
jgi:HK97 gp10 family phage protein